MRDSYYPGSYSLNKQVEVRVFPTYVPKEKIDNDLVERLKPEANIFVYRIEITNFQKNWIRLLSRYWKIIDSEGEEKIITGKGVVGETPKLFNGETFVYSSFCPLEREWGTMEGGYEMEDNKGKRFQIKVNRFYLIKEIKQQASPVVRNNEV